MDENAKGPRTGNFTLKIHLIWLGVMTILLYAVVSMFHVEEYEQVIDHPQFSYIDKYKDILQKIEFDDEKTKSGKEGKWYNKARIWYHVFFIIDFIWAFLLLTILIRIVVRYNRAAHLTILIRAMVFFAAVSYLLDVAENTIYLLLYGGYHIAGLLDFLIRVKTGCYAITFFLFLLHLYMEFIQPNRELIRKSLAATRFSIIIILVLFILCIQMDQGSTVIVHLLDQPVNCIVAIFMVNLLAFACAHYPSYLEMRKSNQVNWKMKPKWLKENIGLGLIFYEFHSSAPAAAPKNIHQALISQSLISQRQQTQHSFSSGDFFEHFRKAIGGLFYLCWLYALLYLYKKYVSPGLPVFALILLYTGLFVLIYWLCQKVKLTWQEHFAKNEQQYISANLLPSGRERAQALYNLMPTNVRICLYYTIGSFVFLLLASILVLIRAGQKDWHITGFCFVIVSVISLVFYVFFQHFRRALGYFPSPWYFRWTGVHLFNNDVLYIAAFSLSGYFCFFTILFSVGDPSKISALVYILMFLYLYYGFSIILFKHFIYYNYNNFLQNNRWVRTWGKFFKYYVPLVPVLLLLWAVFSAQAGNGLHRLETKSEEANQISVKAFWDDFTGQAKDTTMYYVASYGGGLRATAWTMLLLDKLNKKFPDFINHTVAMSGVSGGFIGLAMYNAIRTEYPEVSTHSEIISRIGMENVLAIELSYVLGFDLIREGMPYFPYLGPDRDRVALDQYASLITSDTSLTTLTYKSYWKKGFNLHAQHHQPVLIGNTTGTHGRYGIAFPLEAEQSQFDSIFPGAVNILTVTDTTSIRYLDAASTTERFPVFSPAAEIDHKGFFLDGGYFENSGLLSLHYFKEYSDSLLGKTLRNKFNQKFILIINSKEAYVRKVLGDSAITKNQLASGELGAILGTVANIDILPIALEKRLQNLYGNDFIPIYLPYKFNMDFVEGIIRGEPADPFSIQELINENNEVIDSVWNTLYKSKSPLVEPVLTRVLSEPAFHYMEAMLFHPHIDTSMLKID